MGANAIDVSFKVQSTLAAYRGVTILSGTAETVAYPESDQRPCIGVTMDTVLETGLSIPVRVAGIAPLYFNDTVGVGQLVALDTSGRGIPFAFGATIGAGMTATSAYLGILVDAAVAATGTIARVLIQPGFER